VSSSPHTTHRLRALSLSLSGVPLLHVGEQASKEINKAFSKKEAEARKDWLRQYKPGSYLDQNVESISYTDFINKELILFSRADCERSIPALMDGLKVSTLVCVYYCAYLICVYGCVCVLCVYACASLCMYMCVCVDVCAIPVYLCMDEHAILVCMDERKMEIGARVCVWCIPRLPPHACTSLPCSLDNARSFSVRLKETWQRSSRCPRLPVM
jgi:C-terminal associated domain of TOPRIM